MRLRSFVTTKGGGSVPDVPSTRNDVDVSLLEIGKPSQYHKSKENGN